MLVVTAINTTNCSRRASHPKKKKTFFYSSKIKRNFIGHLGEKFGEQIGRNSTVVVLYSVEFQLFVSHTTFSSDVAIILLENAAGLA